MATATDPLRQKPPIVIPIAAPSKSDPALRNYHWAKWALAIGLVIALVIVWQLWRTHVQNTVTYETTPLERGVVQSSVTATGAVML